MLNNILHWIFSKRALEAAKQAHMMAEERSRMDCYRAPAILYLRECRQQVRRKTGIDYGAMNPEADPDERPSTTWAP